ncbi:nuclear transcription factor Y subunit B [Striga asiatica]|uniref:Nuclear transcription factor Y subunit B n=1 Tax=Striga asiatica TaxID=4170 RepID=A0A5A7R0U8_STRAF|nr:nuclear transcription factor Y subunit B [Striga asiatica]
MYSHGIKWISEFSSMNIVHHILCLLNRASDKCQKEKRKTINGDDLLWAMATLGFEDYIAPLKSYLARYREGDTKGSIRGNDGSVRKDASGVSQLHTDAQALFPRAWVIQIPRLNIENVLKLKARMWLVSAEFGSSLDGGDVFLYYLFYYFIIPFELQTKYSDVFLL